MKGNHITDTTKIHNLIKAGHFKQLANLFCHKKFEDMGLEAPLVKDLID